MADFSVKIQVLNNSQETLTTMSGRIGNIADDAKHIISQVGRTAIGNLFDTIQSYKTYNDISNCSNDMRNLATALENIAKLYGTAERSIIDRDFSEGRTINVMGQELSVGDTVMGFVVTYISADGQITLERENHILEEVCDKYPLLGALAFLANPGQTLIANGALGDVDQKIIIDTGHSWSGDGDVGNWGNANGQIESSVFKIQYITEGEYYRSELEITPLGTGAAGEVRTWDPETLFSPSSFLSGEAEAGVLSIEGNVRYGTEEDNINFGFGVDVLSAEANINGGAGDLSYVDAAGERQEGNGVSVGAGASASVVEGTFTIQAVNNGNATTVSVSADAGGVGGSAGLSVTDEGMAAELDIEAILGLGIAVSQDW